MNTDSISKRSLVAGARGQVGSQLMARLTDAVPTTSHTPLASERALDFSRLRSVSQVESLLVNLHLDAIYCVGGMTNVEQCEAEPDAAMRINCEGPAVLANYAYSRKLPFVYFSTEYIFDGCGGPFDERAYPAPLSVYGRSKWAGEQAVLAAHPEALILRTTVVYGPDPAGRNFLHALRRSLLDNRQLLVPEDQISTPTYNRDLGRAAVTLVNTGATGIFNVCGPERMSRLELARRAAAFWGLSAEKIVAVGTKELRQSARRPLEAGLSIFKLQRLYPQLKMKKLEASLHDWSSV